MTLFILFFVGERLIETHFTKINHKWNGENDLPLNLITLAYILMLLSGILEFYLFKNTINKSFTISGLFILSISLFLRWSSIIELGHDWSILTYAMPENIHRGFIYKFFRHPYYLGVILETIAFPMILNSLIAFLFSIIFIMPLEIIRGKQEENNLINEWGWPYIKFIREVYGYFPTFFQRVCFERRERNAVLNDGKRRKETDRRTKLINVKKDRRKLVYL